MPPRRNARRGGASASRSATDSANLCNEGDDKESTVCKSSARGRGKRKAPGLLSPGKALPEPVERATGDSLEVTDRRKSLTEPLPRRILRSDSCIRVVESSDGPPLKKRRSEPVRLRQNTPSKEREKLPESVAQVLLCPPHPAGETEEHLHSLSSNSAAEFSSSLSVGNPNETITEELNPTKDISLDCREASSGIQVKQVDDEKLLMKSSTSMQSETSPPSMWNESPVLQAKYCDELSSSSSTSMVTRLFVSDSDTTLRIHQVDTRSKPLDARIALERMTSRSLMDCLRIESEEDFKPDYDEDDKHDLAGNTPVRGAHSIKSCSSQSGVTTSITNLLSTPFQASAASSPLPLTTGQKSTLLFQPCPSTPKSKCPVNSGRAGSDGDAKEGTRKILSQKETEDSLDVGEICQPALTDCPLSDGVEESEVAIMNDLSSLNDDDFVSHLSLDLLRSPVSLSSQCPSPIVKVTGRSKPFNLTSKFQSVQNEQVVDLNKCLVRPSFVEKKYSDQVSPDFTANPQVSYSSSMSSQLVSRATDGSKPLNLTSKFVQNEQVFDLNKCLVRPSLVEKKYSDQVSPDFTASPQVSCSSSMSSRSVRRATDGSKPFNLTSKFQSVQNEKVVIRPSLVEQKYSDRVTPDCTALPQVSCSSSTSSLHVTESVIKGAKDVDQPSFSFRDLPTKDGVNSSIKNLCLPLSSGTSSSDQLTQSIAVQTEEEEKFSNSSEIQSDYHARASCLLPGNTEHQSESKCPISLPSEVPFVNQIQSAAEDNSVAKEACQVIKVSTSFSPSSTTTTTKSRISPRIPAANGSESILKKVVPEPILDSKPSPSVNDDSNPKKIRLKRPWKIAKKQDDAVSDTTLNTSSATVSSPVNQSLEVQDISPSIAVFHGKSEPEVSSGDATRMKQPSEVEMDAPHVLPSSSPIHVSVSVSRQSSQESGASEELLEGDGSSNEEDMFNEVNLSWPVKSEYEQRSPIVSNHLSPAMCSQHSSNQCEEELLTKSLLPAEECQLSITVTAGERRSLISLPDRESSFADDVATWVSHKETKTDSLLKTADIKKSNWNLSSKAFIPDLSTDLFEELTCEEFGSDFEDEFDDSSKNSPTKDALCESLVHNVATSGGSLSSEEEKCGLPIPDSSDTLIRTGWFPIPSRKRSTMIPAKSSVGLLPSEPMTKSEVTTIIQDPPAIQSPRFTTELQTKRTACYPSAATNRFAGTKDWLVTKGPAPETMDYVFQNIKNLIGKQDWRSLAYLFLKSDQRQLCMSYLAESLMSMSDVSDIGSCFRNLVLELEALPDIASEQPSFRKRLISLAGVHVMERCTAFDNWSDAFEVLDEMLKKKIYFHRSFSHEKSSADIVNTAVRVCVNAKKYGTIEFLVRQLNFFRIQLTIVGDPKKLIKQKYCCLNVVLVAIVQELPLPVTEGQMEKNDKLVLCNVGINILRQILMDWKEDVSKQPEVAELIELTFMFEFFIQGCMVHNCSDGLIQLSRLQERHPEYLKWKTPTLHTVILFFLKLGMMQVLLGDEPPLNLIRTATERQLIPELPEYVPSKSNVLVVWSDMSDLEMRLVIVMYLKSILLKVRDDLSEVSSVQWSIELLHRDTESVIGMKGNRMESMCSLQRLLSSDISPPLHWSKLSPMLLRIDQCTVSVIRHILSNSSVDLKLERPSLSYQQGCSTSQLPHSLPLSEAEHAGTGDVDLRRLHWIKPRRNAESRVGFSSRPTSQPKEINETLNRPPHLSTPQNRSSRVRKSLEDKRSNTSLVSSAPVRFTERKMPYEYLKSVPAAKIPKVDSFVSSVPKIAMKDFSSSVSESSSRKVLLQTPHYTDESPKLLHADASVSGIHLKSNEAVGSFVETPSDSLVLNPAHLLSDALRDRKMKWDGPSSRRQKVSLFQRQNTVASSSNSGPKLQHQDLRQQLASKKVPRLVNLPSKAGTPVKKLLDLDLLPRPLPPFLNK